MGGGESECDEEETKDREEGSAGVRQAWFSVGVRQAGWLMRLAWQGEPPHWESRSHGNRLARRLLAVCVCVSRG